MTDAQLVRATLEGDQTAFGELVRRYRDAAFGIAFHRLGDFEAARDAAQEALITAYTDLDRLREPDKFGHWLYQIATTTALGLLRRRRLTVPLDSPEMTEHPSPDPTPAESAERTEKARQVREALEALQESDRLALILHYVNGYSHDEIGSMLGSTTSSVKSRIHRARGRLREEMQQMVEDTLKSEKPGIEFTESLVRLALSKDKDQGVAYLAYVVPGRVEYTPQTLDAICRVASELAQEGYSWLFAPPHIPSDSRAFDLLRGIGFQVEIELHWYERSLSGRLPAVPPLDPGIEIGRYTDADPGAVMAFIDATIVRDGAAHLSEDFILNQQKAPDVIPEASFVARRGERIVSVVTSHKAFSDTPKYDAGSVVLGWTLNDDAPDAMKHIIALALRAIKAGRWECAVKDQLQPTYDRDVQAASVLEQLGFKLAKSQYVLKLDLKSRSWDTCPGQAMETASVPMRELKPLRFSVIEGDRDPKYANALEVNVSEVLGTSPVIRPGDIYLVSGEYTIAKPIVPYVGLGNNGTSWGFTTCLSEGAHQFAAGANIVAVNPGKEDTLYLHTPGLEGDTVRHAIIRLLGE